MSADNFLLVTADNIVAEGDVSSGLIREVKRFDTPSAALEFAREYCDNNVVEYGIEFSDDNFAEEKRMRDLASGTIPDEVWEEGWG